MTKNNAKAKLVVTIVGIGYVGLSNAVLLAQHNKVYAVDIQPERVNAVNNRCSPIMDKELEEYFAVKDMDLTAVMDGIQALSLIHIYQHYNSDKVVELAVKLAEQLEERN